MSTGPRGQPGAPLEQAQKESYRARHRGPGGLFIPVPAAERFWRRVERTETCWIWHGPAEPRGYGTFYVGRRPDGRLLFAAAHRWAYEQAHGPIPDGLVLDHLCRNPACVNPDHLEPVTPRENTRRGLGHGSETHCPQGHPYDALNTYVRRGNRQCRACWAERRRRAREAAARSAS